MEPTKEQFAALAAIHRHIVEAGIPPTLQELATTLGKKHLQSIAQLLARLEIGGYITRPGKQRSRKIVITPEGERILGEKVSTSPATAPGQAAPEALTFLESETFRLLTDKDPKLGQMYISALRRMKDSSDSESIRYSAYGMRDVIDRLVDRQTPRIKTPTERVIEKCEEIIPKLTKPISSEEAVEIVNEISSTAKLAGRRPPPRAERLRKAADPLAREEQEMSKNAPHRRLAEMYERLSGIAKGSVISLPEYKAHVEELGWLLSEVFLPPQGEMFRKLDKLLAAGPDKCDAATLRMMMDRNMRTKEYVYEKAGPEWVDFLLTNKFLPAEWEPGNYLARIAVDIPEKVMATIEKISTKKDNPDAINTFVIAASRMPGIGSRMVPLIVNGKWLRDSRNRLLQHYATDLLKRLIADKSFESACTLFGEFLALRKDPNRSWRPTSVVDDYEYQNAVKLLELVPDDELLPFIQLMAKLAASYFKDGALIRASIEESSWNSQYKDLDDYIIDALRDMLERHIVFLISSKSSSAADSLGEILKHDPDDKCGLLFTELKLHLYSLHPETFKTQIEVAVDEFFGDQEIWHEYTRLIERSFSILSEASREQYLAMVADGSRLKDNEEYREYLRARYYAVVRPYLPADLEKKYKAAMDSMGGPSDPTFITGRSEMLVGPRSHLPKEEIEKKTLDDMIHEFVEFAPSDEFMGPSRAGFGREFHDYVAAHPELAAHAEKFADERIRPVYVFSYLSGLVQIANNQRAVDWSAVLRLARVIIARAKAGELPFVAEETEQLEADWGEVFKEVLRCLNFALNDSELMAVKGNEEIAWDTIQYLVKHPDPTPEHEAKYGGTNMNPYTLAINTVRGEAYQVLFSYLFWVNRKKGAGERLVPDKVKELLEAGLNTQREPGLMVRAVYGKYLPNLLLIGGEWAASLLDSLLPTGDIPRRYAAWETYLIGPVFEEVYKQLSAYYLLAIAELGKVTLDRSVWVDPFDRLAEQMAIAHAYGIDAGNPAAPQKEFFKSAPEEYRAQAISFAGRAFISREKFAPGERIPDISNLKALWESRLVSSKSIKELAQFGWWAKQGRFDDEWMLQKLLETLQKTGGKLDGEFIVFGSLKELVDRYPGLCAEILDLAVRGADRGSFVLQTQSNEISWVLERIRQSTNEPARRIAAKAVDYLLRLGLHGYRSPEDIWGGE